MRESKENDNPVLEAIIQEDGREKTEERTFYPALMLPLLIRTQFARSNFDAILEHLQNYERIAELDQWRRVSASWPCESVDIAVAYANLAEGKFKEAEILLQKLQLKAEIAGRNGNLIELLLLRALALKAIGNNNQAIELAIKAVTIAEPEGYIRIFIDLGASIATLLKEVAKRNISPHFVHKLLVEFEKARPNRPVSVYSSFEPLTSRELEILNLLAAGLSYQEIAQKLILTVGTIKTHTHHIYAKLGVRSRTHAIKRATGLNLIFRLFTNPKINPEIYL